MKIKNDKLFIQIICLICSIALWVMVMIQTNPPQEKNITNVPIKIKNLTALENSNMVLMNSDKDNLTVNIKVKGNSDELIKLKNSDFTATIDVLGFVEGTTNAKVEVSGPNGLDINSIYPTQIACKVESIVSKVMDVTVQYEGEHANNYYRVNGTPNPTSVKVTGPRSVVDSANLAIATVNVEGAKEDVVKTVPVRIYDGKDTEIFMSVPTGNVEVTVPIYPTKYVNLKTSIIGEPLEGYDLVDVSVNPSRVRIAGRQDIIDTINELELAELDISGAYNNILSSKEILNGENLIFLDLPKTPVVNAMIEEVIEKEFEYNLDEIQFSNLNEGYDINLPETDNEIKVTVVGTKSNVNSLKKDDISLNIDLSDASLGSNTYIIESITDNEALDITLNLNTIDVEIIEVNSDSEDNNED